MEEASQGEQTNDVTFTLWFAQTERWMNMYSSMLEVHGEILGAEVIYKGH